MTQKLPRTALAHYIAQSTDSRDSLAREVAAYLVDNAATNDLDSLIRDVVEIQATQNGVVELTAKSAHPIDNEVKSRIEAVAIKLYPGTKRVIIHTEIDKSVIGGARLQFANADLDMTVQSKLHKLRETIT